MAKVAHHCAKPAGIVPILALFEVVVVADQRSAAQEDAVREGIPC